ncbi:MBL fold metallo-hydrolase [Parasphingorhabdus pacifica]
MTLHGWQELGDGVLIRRYAELDLTVGLVVGEEQALVIDTRGDHTQGTELAEAVRRVTSLPVQVALTHGHFDHCFGTSALLPAPVWAHEGCGEFLARTSARQRDHWVAHYRAEGRPEVAAALTATEPALPDHPVGAGVDLQLGGRSVSLRHLGPGHTDHDLVIAVADAGVVFAGDLVEQGGPPDYEDAHPAAWPSTLDAMLALGPMTVVPGHGHPVTPEFVRAQRAEISTLADLCRRVAESTATTEEAVRLSPFPAETTRMALDRRTNP